MGLLCNIYTILLSPLSFALRKFLMEYVGSNAQKITLAVMQTTKLHSGNAHNEITTLKIGNVIDFLYGVNMSRIAFQKVFHLMFFKCLLKFSNQTHLIFM